MTRSLPDVPVWRLEPMNTKQTKQINDVLERMRQLPSLSPGRRHSLDRLEAMGWADDVAALSRLWSAAPELVEQYLDVMVAALHAFPVTAERELAATAALRK